MEKEVLIYDVKQYNNMHVFDFSQGKAPKVLHYIDIHNYTQIIHNLIKYLENKLIVYKKTCSKVRKRIPSKTRWSMETVILKVRQPNATFSTYLALLNRYSRSIYK